jgi:hypothetical protein
MVVMQTEAVRVFDKARVIEPRDSFTGHNQGLATAKSGREKETVDCFSRYRDLSDDRQTGNPSRRLFR